MMKDNLISRQAAIDAAIEAVDYWDGGANAHRETIIEKALLDIPTAQTGIVRCHQCIHWDRDTVRQNSNDAGWWNEAICERYSDEIWTSWKDADWYCADAERRTDERFNQPKGGD